MSRWITIEAAELAVKALEEENARLKAEVKKFKLTLKQDRQISRKDLNDLRFEKDKAQQSLENAKAEIVRLRSFTTRTIIPNEQLQAQVERLTKAGDAMAEHALLAHWGSFQYLPIGWKKLIPEWNAAKEVQP